LTNTFRKIGVNEGVPNANSNSRKDVTKKFARIYNLGTNFREGLDPILDQHAG